MKRLMICFVACSVSMQLSAESEYLFEQQYDDGCRVLPLVNLHKLQRLSKQYGSQNIIAKAPWYEWHSRRESLGVFFPFYYAWINSFNILNANPQKYPHLHAFLSDMATYGPVFPHFYDASGHVPSITIESEEGTQRLMEYSLNDLPFSLIDYGALVAPDQKMRDDFANIQYLSLEQLSFELPIINTLLPFGKNKASKNGKEDYVLYNTITRAYDVIQVKDLSSLKSSTKCGYEYPLDILKDVTLPESTDLFVWQYKKYSQLNELGAVYMGSVAFEDENGNCVPEYPLGFEEIGFIKKLPLELKIGTNTAYGSGLDIFGKSVGTTSYSPRDMGRTKLMFLRLGVDAYNQDITPEHPLYGAYQDFKNLVNNSANNPWSDTYCKKEEFLQYHIARTLKNNTDLCDQLERAITELRTQSEENTIIVREQYLWEQYTKFLEAVNNGQLYRDRNGSAYDARKIMSFMLGKEQMLAYLAASVVRMLWYGAIHEKAFQERTGFEKVTDFLDLVDKKNSETKDGKKVSFIDIWQQITKDCKGKNFFSFEQHGWVVSFDNAIIVLQEKKFSSAGKQIIKRIGCTAIESIYASDFKDSFYKKDRKTSHVLQDEYARIALVEELARQLIAAGTFDISVIKGLSDLKKINSEGKQLSKEQIKTLATMEEKLKPYKQQAEEVQNKAAQKIQRAFKSKKGTKPAVDLLGQAFTAIGE